MYYKMKVLRTIEVVYAVLASSDDDAYDKVLEIFEKDSVGSDYGHVTNKDVDGAHVEILWTDKDYTDEEDSDD